MVLPRSKGFEGREVSICMIARFRRPSYTLDVHSDKGSANVGDLRTTDADLGDAEYSHNPIKEPDCASSIEPLFIAPCSSESEFHMVPRPDYYKYRKDDVHNQENFVRPPSHVQDARNKHDADSEGGDDAPDPERVLFGCCEYTLVFVQHKVANRVNDDLYAEDARHPTVHKHVRRMRPVGAPE